VLLAADGRYALGSFDGQEFKPDGGKQAVWHGNFYASQSFSNAPDHRRIQIGWARGTDFPGMPFNQQMNIPVELRLKSTEDGLRLTALPVHEIERLRERKRIPDSAARSVEIAESADLDLVFRPGKAERVVLNVRGLPVVYDARKNMLSTKKISAPLAPQAGAIRLRVIVDRGSVEIFGNDGRVALAVASIAPRDNHSVTLSVEGGDAEVEAFEIWDFRSIWK
jgi:fructan beta-fructosidase